MYTNGLSKKLTPAPLTKPVTYRLLSAGHKVAESDRPTSPTLVLKGEETIYDPGDKAGEGRDKALRLVTGSTPNPYPQPGQSDTILTIGEIISRNGFITVAPRQKNAQAIYEFLERSNYNLSNLYRSPDFTPMFEKVDVLASAQVEAAKDDLLDDAMAALRSLSAEKKIEFAVAKTLAGPDDDLVVITQALRKYAKAKPQDFLDEIDSPELQAKAVIAQAIAHRIIIYNPTSGDYQFTEPKGVTLFTVPVGFDGPTSLTKYLLSADVKAVAQLKELARQVKSVTGAK